MKYSQVEDVRNKIKKDIEEINTYPDVEHFIQSNFQQFLRNGEYDDNSLDLNHHYKMLKEIEEDDKFLSKLQFVLYNYVPSNLKT